MATELCFRLPRLNCIPRSFEKYIHGEWIDRNPLSIEAEISDENLHISYGYKESLRIIVPWEIEGLGVFFLKTVSLPKTDRPYDLVLELARGTVGRLVDQSENWKASGLELTDDLNNQLDLVKLNFRRAAFSEDDERFQFAMVAIGASIHLMNEVGGAFSDYVFELRRGDNQPNTALVGAAYYETPVVNQAGIKLPGFEKLFNAAVVSGQQLRDRGNDELLTVLHSQGITTCSEPLFDFREKRKSDFPSIDEAESWILADADRKLGDGLAGCKLLFPVSSLGFHQNGGWNQQEQIHLTYELFSHIKSNHSQCPLIVGVDQPFGESQIANQTKSPLQMADNLIRMETPIAAFSLEVNVGYYPDGTWIRDLYAFNDLLDAWGQFDYPLVLQLRIPGGVQTREGGDGESFVAAGFDSQASWLDKIYTLAIAKHNVAGVFYSQLFDRPNDDFFGAGLISNQGISKPALEAIQKIRQKIA